MARHSCPARAASPTARATTLSGWPSASCPQNRSRRVSGVSAQQCGRSDYGSTFMAKAVRRTAMKKLVLLAMMPLLLAFAPVGQTTTITLLHFSDYHSHAVPFYAEGQ